jgi:hypothetical protein
MLDVHKARRLALIALVMGLLLIQPLDVNALTASEAKQAWIAAKEASRKAQEAHRKANIDWAASKTDENNQKVIDTGKAALQAALNEVEAWLTWTDLEVKENPEIPENLKATIHNDVTANLAKIDVLRGEVDAVGNRIQLATVFLKMIGKYIELVTDVARNTGLVWVHIAETYADTVEDYEAELRTAAKGASNESDVLAKLDQARSDLDKARTNIGLAEAEYTLVKLPGNPILKFANGNNYLRIARNDLLAAHASIKQAYLLLAGTS